MGGVTNTQLAALLRDISDGQREILETQRKIAERITALEERLTSLQDDVSKNTATLSGSNGLVVRVSENHKDICALKKDFENLKSTLTRLVWTIISPPIGVIAFAILAIIFFWINR